MSTWLSVTPMRNSQKLPLHTSSLVLKAVPLLPAPGLSCLTGMDPWEQKGRRKPRQSLPTEPEKESL